MCLIIYKPTATTKLPKYIVDNAESINKDGFGITYLDNFKTHKTMNYKHARKLIKAKRPFVAHYRYTTRGNTNRYNCHPFTINKTNMLYSNGTVADLGSDNVTDTAIVAEYLKTTPRSHWHKMLTMTDVRFALVTYRGSGIHVAKMPQAKTFHHGEQAVHLYGKWYERDGVYYSKDNCFFKSYTTNAGYSYRRKPSYVNTAKQYGYASTTWYEDDPWANPDTWSLDYDAQKDNPMNWHDNYHIAVYGTLKSDKGNHQFHLSDAIPMGKGVTVDKYPMTGDGLPYVYNHAGVGHNITVEVYDVRSYTSRQAIDSLESHPTWYTRKRIDVRLDSGTIISAWMYFIDEVPFDIENKTLISCY